MRTLVYLGLLGGLLLFGGAVRAQTQEARTAPPAGGTVLTIEGKVEIARSGTNEWTLARTNQLLHVGDRVRTGPQSRATLRLSNQSVLRVNQLTTLVIQPPQAANAQATLDLKSGAVFFYSREPASELQFRTPLASGAIRGTEFNLAVAEDGRTTVALLEGAVSLSNDLGTVNLSPNEQGVVAPGQPPAKTAVLDAVNLIQWSLYYPAVLDLDELGLSAAEQAALSDSLSAYRAGELLKALAAYPAGRQPATDAERILRAGLLLAVGQVDEANALLGALAAPTPLADALRELIAAVKFQPWPRTAAPTLATEWMSESYHLQSRSQLAEALRAARHAAAKSPRFGFAWARVAELEFSFGHVPAARAALEQALTLAPRNAQALALKGFLLAAENQIGAAEKFFEQAIEVDGALGHGWLGRGLCRIRQGDADAGRRDLQTAAALEPHRAMFRSYLGKAFSNARDHRNAARELDRARQLDPQDPTSWLYLALLEQQENRINEAIDALEQSQARNENRRVYRSRLLLDQDRAVRSANLAAIYRDAGMTDLSAREAARAVNSDYANYSAHQFLASSYDALRDPKQVNLRYETPWLSELLVANLLAPVGAGSLSQYVSQQEYSKLFERDRLGISSSTEYQSRGDWGQTSSQFGTFGNSSYALDVDYRSQNGQRPNNDFTQLSFFAKFKQQLTPQDSVYFQAITYDADSGDARQYYRPGDASTTFRVQETQQPNLFAGYHHEWQPGNHTLVLLGRLQDTLTETDSAGNFLFLRKDAENNVTAVTPRKFGLAYRSELEAYSAEVQQLWQHDAHTLVGGARYQTGQSETSATISRVVPDAQDVTTDLARVSVYAYYYWQLHESLQLIGGLSYDRLHYPSNIDVPPLTSHQESKELVSPKAGLVWTPLTNTTVRGVYSRSLGGVFYDNSVRLEPVQIAAFTQAFRSVIPESVVGLVPGSEFETWGAAVDQRFPTRTYVSLAAEQLNSDATRALGVYESTGPFASAPGRAPETLRYRENTLYLTINQLVAESWSLGATYRYSDARLHDQLTEIPTALSPDADKHVAATLQQLNLFALFNHRSGFFSQVNSVWSHQSNRGYRTAQPGDDFWQFNVQVGYRFLHRAAEVRLGLLNVADRDYQLNPLNLYSELPRARTLAVTGRFYF